MGSNKTLIVIIFYFTIGATGLAFSQSNQSIPLSYYSAPINRTMKGDTLCTQIQLYFRWDKDVIDSTYLSNRQTLRILDELLNINHLRSMEQITIIAYASPEGPPDYNQRLSERRGKAVRKLLLNRYSHLEGQKIEFKGRGENWEGLYAAIESDPNVPSRDKLLALLKAPLSAYERDKRMQALDKGVPYRYLYRTFYKQLRNASSIYINIIPKSMPEVVKLPRIEVAAIPPSMVPVPIHTPQLEVVQEVPYRYIRPVAIKSNLLFDIALMPNIELEFPIGKHFSLMGEWTFPFWGGLGNDGGVAPVPVYSEKFTMQMLSGGAEVRYWFPRSKSLDRKAQKWGDYNPLVGWFVGLYGGAGLYDFQFGGNGMQGEFYIAAGISAGFAHPIGKYFHMEYSVGVGYLATEYYRYTPLDGHKVVIIRPNGKYDRRRESLIGPTKAKISLVWIPRFKIKGKL